MSLIKKNSHYNLLHCIIILFHHDSSWALYHAYDKTFFYISTIFMTIVKLIYRENFSPFEKWHGLPNSIYYKKTLDAFEKKKKTRAIVIKLLFRYNLRQSMNWGCESDSVLSHYIGVTRNLLDKMS